MDASVLLHYHGGEVYAVPEEVHGFLALRVAGVRVAVTPMEPCPVWPTTGGFETGGTLTDLVAAGAHHRRMAREAAARAATKATQAKAKRTGKGRAKRPTRGTEHTARLAEDAGLTVDAQTWGSPTALKGVSR
jgi:hypothetical protein